MVPAAVVDPILADVTPLLEPGDIVIDGGNSYYHDDIRRARELKGKGLHYVDVGVSGGVWGKERGYCHMIGGEDAVVKRLDPIFQVARPRRRRRAAHARRDGRAGPGGNGLSALRPERRRTFRQDGPQRHRIRADGRLRRRA